MKDDIYRIQTNGLKFKVQKRVLRSAAWWRWWVKKWDWVDCGDFIARRWWLKTYDTLEEAEAAIERLEKVVEWKTVEEDQNVTAEKIEAKLGGISPGWPNRESRPSWAGEDRR